MQQRKKLQQHEVVTEFVNMTKLGQIKTVEDYFKYRRAHMHDLSLRERHLLMAWLNRSEAIRLKGKRHKETIHSEIEMRKSRDESNRQVTCVYATASADEY